MAAKSGRGSRSLSSTNGSGREPDGAAEVALKLAEYRKLDPGPIEEWIFYDHPSGRSRIHMAMTWKAENPNEEDGASALE